MSYFYLKFAARTLSGLLLLLHLTCAVSLLLHCNWHWWQLIGKGQFKCPLFTYRCCYVQAASINKMLFRFGGFLYYISLSQILSEMLWYSFEATLSTPNKEKLKRRSSHTSAAAIVLLCVCISLHDDECTHSTRLHLRSPCLHALLVVHIMHINTTSSSARLSSLICHTLLLWCPCCLLLALTNSFTQTIPCNSCHLSCKISSTTPLRKLSR